MSSPAPLVCMSPCAACAHVTSCAPNAHATLCGMHANRHVCPRCVCHSARRSAQVSTPVAQLVRMQPHVSVVRLPPCDLCVCRHMCPSSACHPVGLVSMYSHAPLVRTPPRMACANVTPRAPCAPAALCGLSASRRACPCCACHPAWLVRMSPHVSLSVRLPPCVVCAYVTPCPLVSMPPCAACASVTTCGLFVLLSPCVVCAYVTNSVIFRAPDTLCGSCACHHICSHQWRSVCHPWFSVCRPWLSVCHGWLPYVMDGSPYVTHGCPYVTDGPCMSRIPFFSRPLPRGDGSAVTISASGLASGHLPGLAAPCFAAAPALPCRPASPTGTHPRSGSQPAPAAAWPAHPPRPPSALRRGRPCRLIQPTQMPEVERPKGLEKLQGDPTTCGRHPSFSAAHSRLHVKPHSRRELHKQLEEGGGWYGGRASPTPFTSKPPPSGLRSPLGSE